jgi:hypothetical protein
VRWSANTANGRWNGVSWQAKLVFVILVVSIAGFISSEIWLTGFLLVWALAGLMHAGLTGIIIFSVIIFPLALWATWYVCILAWQSESELLEQEVSEAATIIDDPAGQPKQ